MPILDRLLSSNRVTVCGVATQPDRPAGRRRYPKATPVGERAGELGIALRKLQSVNDPTFLRFLREVEPEVVLVTAFGQILGPRLLALPATGCINIHASLLPRHRGAAPVSAAILAGDDETGISFMKMDEGLDTGPVYLKVRTPIGPLETAGELERRLACLAAQHAEAVIWGAAREGLPTREQTEENATYAVKLQKKDGLVDWRRSAFEIGRHVRALFPWPKAFTFFPTRKGLRRVQLAAVTPEAALCDAPPGTILKADDSHGLIVACGAGRLCLDRLVPEGRREMGAAEFLRGHPLQQGTMLACPPEHS